MVSLHKMPVIHPLLLEIQRGGTSMYVPPSMSDDALQESPVVYLAAVVSGHELGDAFMAYDCLHVADMDPSCAASKGKESDLP